MLTYHVLTAMLGGVLKTALVHVDEINDSPARDFFPPDAEDVTDRGEIVIEGAAKHMVPEILLEGD